MITVTLTNAERLAVLRALSEILDGNARDFGELKLAGYSLGVVRAMERVEGLLRVRPDTRQDIRDDYYEECKADAQSGREED